VTIELEQPLEPGTYALAEIDKMTSAQACNLCGVQDDDLEGTVLCDQCEAPYHMCVLFFF
jgi:hypothetical protein